MQNKQVSSFCTFLSGKADDIVCKQLLDELPGRSAAIGHLIKSGIDERVFEIYYEVAEMCRVAPGHRDFAKNMVAGTSQADCAAFVFYGKQLLDINFQRDLGTKSVSTFIQDTEKCSSCVQIFVKTLTGRHFALDVKLSYTVECVKAIIQEKEGILIGQQRLVHCNKEMEKGKTLSDYKIQTGSSLHLLLLLKGGNKKTTKTKKKDSDEDNDNSNDGDKKISGLVTKKNSSIVNTSIARRGLSALYKFNSPSKNVKGKSSYLHQYSGDGNGDGNGDGSEGISPFDELVDEGKVGEFFSSFKHPIQTPTLENICTWLYDRLVQSNTTNFRKLTKSSPEKDFKLEMHTVLSKISSITVITNNSGAENVSNVLGNPFVSWNAGEVVKDEVGELEIQNHDETFRYLTLCNYSTKSRRPDLVFFLNTSPGVIIMLELKIFSKGKNGSYNFWDAKKKGYNTHPSYDLKIEEATAQLKTLKEIILHTSKNENAKRIIYVMVFGIKTINNFTFFVQEVK